MIYNEIDKIHIYTIVGGIIGGSIYFKMMDHTSDNNCSFQQIYGLI